MHAQDMVAATCPRRRSGRCRRHLGAPAHQNIFSYYHGSEFQSLSASRARSLEIFRQQLGLSATADLNVKSSLDGYIDQNLIGVTTPQDPRGGLRPHDRHPFRRGVRDRQCQPRRRSPAVRVLRAEHHEKRLRLGRGHRSGRSRTTTARTFGHGSEESGRTFSGWAPKLPRPPR